MQNTHFEAYKSKAKPVIVDVTVPSGHTFKFQRPSKYAILFRYAQMPQVLASVAASEWIEQGLIKPEQAEEARSKAESLDQGAELLRRVCELSYYPKFVVGDVLSDDQFSTDWLNDEDTEYLISWVQTAGNLDAMSGGGPGEQLGNFPEDAGSGSLASANRPKRRRASK